MECPQLSDIVARALAVARLNPRIACDSEREALLDSMSDEQRERLYKIDFEYYDVGEGCMATFREFVVSHREEFCANDHVA